VKARVTRILTAVALGSACASLSACGVSETVNPLSASTTTTTTPTESTTTTDTTTPPDGGPPKRTVSLRSPLAGPAGNLLLDGDFELSSSYGTGQYGWRMFNANGTGELPMTVETGGLCRTGLTCAKFHKGELLFGRGTAAAYVKGHLMEMWAKMPEGVACAKISLIAVTCDTFAALKKATIDKEPDEDGWCHHHGTVPASSVSLCLYVQPSLADGEEALLDSAVLAPDDGTVPFKSTVDAPISEETLTRLSNLRDAITRTTPFGKPPDRVPSRRD